MGDELFDLSPNIRDKTKKIGLIALEQALLLKGQDELLATTHTCPKCQKTLRSNRKYSKTLSTLHGSIQIKRPYFYCSPCHQGYYPFDEKVGLAAMQKQYDLQKPAARLLAELPYATASKLFQELTGESISAHTMHDVACSVEASTDISRVLPSQHHVEQVIQEATKPNGWRPIVVVTADGAHLPTRVEKPRKGKRGPGAWHEAKGFRIYIAAKERIIQLMSWHEISDEQTFGEALDFAATLIPQDKVRIALVADGAPWVWKHMQRAFPKGKEILDYYHCSEHVHKLAGMQYPDTERARAWVEVTMARLFAGDVDGVVHGLHRMHAANDSAEEEIRKLIGYLHHNQHRIDYASTKRGQYPMGSGAIESANKFVCHVRMKRSGAWWYVIHGNGMLRLRCAMINGTFDEVFAHYRKIKKGV